MSATSIAQEKLKEIFKEKPYVYFIEKGVQYGSGNRQWIALAVERGLILDITRAIAQSVELDLSSLGRIITNDDPMVGFVSLQEMLRARGIEFTYHLG